jgi:hypothetical protein
MYDVGDSTRVTHTGAVQYSGSRSGRQYVSHRQARTARTMAAIAGPMLSIRTSSTLLV